jgi:hypothetical protein
MRSDSTPKPSAMGRSQPVNRQREDQLFNAANFSLWTKSGRNPRFIGPGRHHQLKAPNIKAPKIAVT